MTTHSHHRLTTNANDGQIPIGSYYESGDRGLLEHWALDRADREPPYRPRFMVYSGMGTATLTAERLALLQAYGAESFLMATDLPSQLGMDPDHALARAQVGRAGVTIATLQDVNDACAKLDFTKVDSVGSLMNSVGHVGLAMFRAMLEDRGATDVKIMLQNDSLKEFTARGTEIFSPEQALRISCDTVAHAIDERIAGWPITVCSNHYDVAGTGPSIAVAIAFANAIAYMDELVGRGYRPVDVAEKMMFFFNERSDLFVQAGIFRTGRKVWSEILTTRYRIPLGEQPTMTVMGYAHGLESSKEPIVNVARGAISIAGSMLGGVDYLCAAAYDEALRVPSADAAVLAVRTMQVIGMEHGLTATVDPLAGSVKQREIEAYLHEEITTDLESIMGAGGAVAAIGSGEILARLERGRGVREAQIANLERAWVGRNVFQVPEALVNLDGHSSGEIDFETEEREARERVVAYRQHAEPARLAEALRGVTETAAGTANLVPPTYAAVRAGATLQEITDATRAGFDQPKQR